VDRRRQAQGGRALTTVKRLPSGADFEHDDRFGAEALGLAALLSSTALILAPFEGAGAEDERVIDVNAQIADGAVDLRMAEQDLNCTQVARLLIDDGSLGSAQRMRPVVFPAQPEHRYPLVNEPSILPGADVIGMINPARKDEVVERVSSALEPSENAAAGRFKELELNGPSGLLLNNDRS
jgi:hypothetical protein